MAIIKITAGAPANAATWDPMANAVGDLDLLPTTPKTSVSGAIGTTALGTTATTISGAIAEIQATLVPSPNLAFDPFFRYYSPSTAVQDGRLRWKLGTGTRIDDPNSIISGLMISPVGNLEGRRLWIDEMGVKIGDVMSYGVYIYAPTGRTYYIGVEYLNAAGGQISAASHGSVAGDDANHFLVAEAKTIPALTVSINVYMGYGAGSGDCGLFGIYAMKGTRCYPSQTTDGVSDGQRAMAQIQGSMSVTGDPAGRLSYRDNLFTDPFGCDYDPSLLFQDGQSRWGASFANYATKIWDVANPFGLPTLRVNPANTDVSRRFYLVEMGVSVGDVISMGILCKFAATSTMSFAFLFLTAAGGYISNATAPAVAGTAALQFLKFENVTVPATAARIEIFITRATGTDTVDVYGMFACPGRYISETGCKRLGYEQRFSLGGWASQHQVIPPEAGLGNLQSWRRAQSGIATAETGQTARIVVLGDSLTMTPAYWLTLFQTRMAADVGGGLAGAGYVGLETIIHHNMADWGKFTNVAHTGTWTERNITTAPVGKGVDITDVTSTGAGDTFTIAGTFTEATIHYLKQSGGGTFKYSIDGGANWSSNIDTNNGSDLYAIEVITGASNSLVIYANGADVTLFGVELIDGAITNGTVVHKAAYSGAQLGNFVTAGATQPWKDAITALAPDLVIIWLGTNNASTADATNKASLDTIMDSVRVAMLNWAQTITIGGSPTGGDFTLSYGGQTTAALAHNVSTADVQAALQALSSIDGAYVSVTGTAGASYVCRFSETFPNKLVTAITGNPAGLTGGTPTLTVTPFGSVDFLLITPYEFGTAHTYEFTSMSDRVRELAKEYPCGMIDMRQYINYRTTDPYNMFGDPTHVTPYGGAIAAGAIYRALKW